METTIPPLTEQEIRVLGSLIEKELSTPDYYPLSVNALLAACNQRTNREPVLALTGDEVVRALDHLRQVGLVARDPDVGRVPKFSHNLVGKLGIDSAAAAILAELLLRGPQTLGELRGRAERMHTFETISDVAHLVDALVNRVPPLAVKLSRSPGRKEHRYDHLLCGDRPSSSAAGNDAETPTDETGLKRLALLEREVSSLRAEIAAMRDEFAEFKAQF